MTDEELREKVARALDEGAFDHTTPDGAFREFLLERADRAIALCREHYGAEITRLQWERDWARQAVRQEFNEIPSPMAAVGLREQLEAAQAEIARLRRERDEAYQRGVEDGRTPF